MTRLEIVVRLLAGVLADPNVSTHSVDIPQLFDLADQVLAENDRHLVRAQAKAALAATALPEPTGGKAIDGGGA